MKSQLLVVLLIAVIAVNGLSADKFPNGLGAKEYDHGILDSSDERLQWKELNLVDSDENYTEEPEPLDRLGSQMLNFEDEKIQNEFELRNGPNTTTAQPSGGDCESNGGECKKNKKQCKATISTEFTCSSKGVCCIEEAKAQGASELMVEMLSNTILIQGMAIQTLKEDQENLLKNLTRAVNTLTIAILDQGVDLQIMKSNLSDAISNQGMALQINQDSIMSNLSDGFSNEESMLEIVEDNQDIIMSNLTRLGCPEGFFQLSPSGQCMKLFYDQKRTWYEANTTCQSEGLVMAQPSDPATLQIYLVNTYGHDGSKGWPYVWIPARGSGSNYFRWLHPNGALNSNSAGIYYYSPYWYSAPSSSSSFSANSCIFMYNDGSMIKAYPGKPYWYNTCTGRYYYALCELVKE